MLPFFDSMIPYIWPFKYRVRIEGLQTYIQNTKAEQWHFYAIKERHKRHHVCIACAWLARFLRKDSSIFEAGCGSGVNLLWLGQKGFRNLAGADISGSAVELCRALAQKVGIHVNVRQDDSLNPGPAPSQIAGLISVNWLYHVAGASLEKFLAVYRPRMASHGKIAFDMIDASYNDRANNEYHTDDIRLPESARRASEYKLRLSSEEVRSIAAAYGFRVIRHARVGWAIPRSVWLVGAAS